MMIGDRRARDPQSTIARTNKRLEYASCSTDSLLSFIPSSQWPTQTAAHTGTFSVTFYDVTLVELNTSYSLTVFSPSGKLVQIEHALAAVSQGTTSLGIKGACSPLGRGSRTNCTLSIQWHRDCHREEDLFHPHR